MGINILEIGMIIGKKDLVPIFGMIKRYMKDIFPIMPLRERGIINGLMEGNILVVLIEGKKMVWEDIFGVMGEVILDFGKMVNNMDLLYI